MKKEEAKRCRKDSRQSYPTFELIDEIKKKMKGTVYVREDILAHAVDMLQENGIEVYSAPYEANFQLVFWELIDNKLSCMRD